MKVFDNMAAVRARSLVLREHPFAWRLNPAAISALRDEGAITDGDLMIFGLPITVDRDNLSEEPWYWLIAEKPKRA